MLRNIFDYIANFLRPSFYLSGLDYVMSVWRGANTREKGILLLVFAPMFLTTGGLIVSVIYFVLFELPIFLFRLLSWGVLTALFGMAGKFGYKYFTGHTVDFPSANKFKSNEDVIIDVNYRETRTHK